MAVKVDSGPIAATDDPTDVPKEKWHDLMLARSYFLSVNLPYDCRCLLQFVEDAELMHRELGFESAEAMIRNGYDLVPAEIELALEWLKLNPDNGPVPYTKAQQLATEARANPRAKPGGPRQAKLRARNLDSPESITGILGRLARDRPDLLDAFEQGEYKSARAAGIAAGFIHPPTPYQELRRAWKKASAEERRTFLEEVTS